MAAPAQAATVTVSMKGLTFQPAVARAAIGDTVTWSNAASDRHSTTSAGPTPWDSARLSPFSGHFSRVFPIAGSFPYYCTIHRSTGMTGVVKVATKVAPGSGTTATDFVVTLAKVGQQPPTGYVYMVQKAVGSGAFTNVIRTTAATAHLRLTTRGTYKLRAGLQKSSGALNTAWFSDPVTVTVS
jgi:plastocyanin